MRCGEERGEVGGGVRIGEVWRESTRAGRNTVENSTGIAPITSCTQTLWMTFRIKAYHF